MNYSWVSVLDSYLMGLLCTSRLSPHFITFDEWKNKRREEEKREWDENLTAAAFRNVFFVFVRARVL